MVAGNGRGIAPPTLLTTMSSRPNASTAAPANPGGGVQVAQVGGNHHGAAPGRLHLVRDPGQLVRASRADHHVRSGLRQGDRGGRAEPPAGTGDHGHPAGDTEEVQDHGMPPPIGQAGVPAR